jgi:hypothetical protein
MSEQTEKSATDSVNSIDCLVEKLKSKGIDVHCAECDVISFSIDSTCFTLSAKSYEGMWGDCSVIDYEHEQN